MTREESEAAARRWLAGDSRARCAEEYRRLFKLAVRSRSFIKWTNPVRAAARS